MVDPKNLVDVHDEKGTPQKFFVFFVSADDGTTIETSRSSQNTYVIETLLTLLKVSKIIDAFAANS